MLIPLLFVAACSSPIQPTGSVTTTTATVVSPANGALIAHGAQPVILTIANSSTASQGSVSYTFELALDSGFGNVVLSRDVPQGSGRTSLQLETLSPGTYSWHVRTNVAETKGVFTEAMTFTIGPAVVIATPQPSSPVAGANFVVFRPTLTVPNVGHSATTGQFLYQFDIARDAAFVNMIETRVVPEGKGQTLCITSSLPPVTAIFWRVQVTDSASGAKSLVSATSSFTTGTALTSLWRGTVPPGTPGHTDPMGFHWDAEVLVSFTGVSISSPTLEMRQVFDLMDRGFSPQGAIDWMRGNGYPTSAVFVPSHVSGGANDLIQFEFMCIIHVNLHWDVLPRDG